MESVKIKAGKKNLLARTWKSCRRSFPSSRSNRGGVAGLVKSKSWNGNETIKKKMAPEGYIPVYVGQEKQKFAMKMKYFNHPLFTMLLEDAETEYGYNSDGPILLPCELDLFYRVLTEMEAKDVQPLGWSFAYGSCSPFNPNRRLVANGADQMTKGYGSYEPLTPSNLIKMK